MWGPKLFPNNLKVFMYFDKVCDFRVGGSSCGMIESQY